MAKLVNIKGKGATKLIGEIDKALASYDVLKVIATYVRERIYQNTKRGYYAGVRKNLAKFRPLSPGYIQYRQNLLKGAVKDAKKQMGRKPDAKKARQKAIRTFGPFFSPKRSNLTLTGQMLESLMAEVVQGKVVVSIPPTPRDDGLTNQEVAEQVVKERPFLRLDDRGIDQIRRSIIRSLRGLLKNR